MLMLMEVELSLRADGRRRLYAELELNLFLLYTPSRSDPSHARGMLLALRSANRLRQPEPFQSSMEYVSSDEAVFGGRVRESWCILSPSGKESEEVD